MSALIEGLSRGVAQPGSALALGAIGRRFESCRADQQIGAKLRRINPPASLEVLRLAQHRALRA